MSKQKTTTPEALIDLIGELGRETHYLLDDCETSGPIGEEVHTITGDSLAKVSAILDRIDALPFEEPGCILGTGAMLQEAIKQTFLPFLICDGCGTAMTDAELAAEQAKHPELRSCCPERKMRPITREDWDRVRKEWAADLVRLGRRHREVQAEVEQARAEIARGARRTDHRFTP